MVSTKNRTAVLFFFVCAALAIAPAAPLAADSAPAAASAADSSRASAQEEKKDAFVCMEETQEKCDYENKNMELFIKGRDAFDRGRESGDLNEARNIARELIERGDERHGSALMKFIYVQVGLGAHKNLVEAYRWVTADLVAGATYRRLPLERVLNQLTAKMTPEQLAEAKK